jgi:hypothetical protein
MNEKGIQERILMELEDQRKFRSWIFWVGFSSLLLILMFTIPLLAFIIIPATIFFWYTTH